MYISCFQGRPDEEMQRRLQLRAEIQVAPAAGVRSGRRLQGHLHGLVPLPVMLCVQVPQSDQAIGLLRHAKLSLRQNAMVERGKSLDETSIMSLVSFLCVQRTTDLGNDSGKELLIYYLPIEFLNRRIC